MGKKKDKISTEGGDGLNLNNPFASLSGDDLPEGKVEPAKPKAEPKAPSKKIRVELRRLKSGKGGKTVIEIGGLHVLGESGMKQIAKQLKARLGVGGTVKAGKIEIQTADFGGVEAFLEKEGYRPIRCGG